MSYRRGFTLIELLLVLVIVGILAAIAVPQYLDWARNSREVEAPPLLKQVRTLEERYRARTGAYTTVLGELEGGASLVTAGRYYDLGLVGHPTGYCVTATPNQAGRQARLDARSMDATGRLYENDSCS